METQETLDKVQNNKGTYPKDNMEEKFMNAKGIGMLVGIVVGLLIAAAILSICNRNGKIKSNYDERQQLIRGKGYKYSFIAISIYYVLWMVLEVGEVAIPVENAVLIFGGIIVGIITLGIYTVFNNAYWGTNNNKVKYAVTLAIIAVINIAGGISAIINGRMIVNNKVSIPAINFLCGLMMISLFICLTIKAAITKEEE